MTTILPFASPDPAARLPPRRADLASFANAYAVAIRLRECSDVDQFVVRTGNPLQPVRITSLRPTSDQHMLAMVA